MSDLGDDYKALRDFKLTLRDVYGQPCPVCLEKLPKAHPKIMMPQMTCRAHTPHYRDERPDLTQEQIDTALGIEV